MSSLILQSLNEQLKKYKVQAQEDQMNVSSLQARVSELEVCMLEQLKVHSFMVLHQLLCAVEW